MSTYYKEKIKYITDDLMLENFDLYSALKEIKATLGDEDNQFCWKKLSEVKIKLQIITPDYYLLNQLYDQGEFKSHEFQAIADQVKDDVKSAISIMMTIITPHHIGSKPRVYNTGKMIGTVSSSIAMVSIMQPRNKYSNTTNTRTRYLDISNPATKVARWRGNPHVDMK